MDRGVRFDARETVRWKLMGRIMTAFGGPVMDRFVEEQKIEATAEEIERFKRNLRRSRERSPQALAPQLTDCGLTTSVLG